MNQATGRARRGASRSREFSDSWRVGGARRGRTSHHAADVRTRDIGAGLGPPTCLWDLGARSPTSSVCTWPSPSRSAPRPWRLPSRTAPCSSTSPMPRREPCLNQRTLNTLGGTWSAREAFLQRDQTCLLSRASIGRGIQTDFSKGQLGVGLNDGRALRLGEVHERGALALGLCEGRKGELVNARPAIFVRRPTPRRGPEYARDSTTGRPASMRDSTASRTASTRKPSLGEAPRPVRERVPLSLLDISHDFC